MGFLDRLIGAVNQTADAATDVQVELTRDRRLDAPEHLAAAGAQVEGVVTGIDYSLDDEVTVRRFRVEWRDPEPRAAGLELAAVPLDVMRLGATVPLRVDGDRAVLDPAYLGSHPVSRFCRAPDPGVRDTAIDWSVQRRLKKAERARVSVVSLERCVLLGVATMNLDLVFRRADGSRTTARRTEVPEYCRRLIVPEAAVIVGVDPRDPGRCALDPVATAEAAPGGSWRDPVPPGSASEVLSAVTPSPVMSMGTDDAPAVAAGGLADGIEGVTLDRLAMIDAALIADRVPPASYDAFAAERYEVPAGRYAAIKAGWDERIRSDWRTGAAYGEAFERARKDLKRRR